MHAIPHISVYLNKYKAVWHSIKYKYFYTIMLAQNVKELEVVQIKKNEILLMTIHENVFQE